MSINDSKFGLSLCLQFNQEIATAPDVIHVICGEIEKRAASFNEIDLYNCLYQTMPTAEVNQICDELNNDLRSELSGYSLENLNGVLKKFLRELPDPVIPVQFYDHFIEAASKFLLFFFLDPFYGLTVLLVFRSSVSLCAQC